MTLVGNDTGDNRWHTVIKLPQLSERCCSWTCREAWSMWLFQRICTCAADLLWSRRSSCLVGWFIRWCCLWSVIVYKRARICWSVTNHVVTAAICLLIKTIIRTSHFGCKDWPFRVWAQSRFTLRLCASATGSRTVDSSPGMGKPMVVRGVMKKMRQHRDGWNHHLQLSVSSISFRDWFLTIMAMHLGLVQFIYLATKSAATEILVEHSGHVFWSSNNEPYYNRVGDSNLW